METSTDIQSAQFPMTKPAIWAVAFIAPIVGAILYYSWRRKTPAAAEYANRASFVGFFFWVAVYIITHLT
jgi:hypothetical protein